VSSVSCITYTETDTTTEENENDNTNAVADVAATNGHETSLVTAHPIAAAISTASFSSSNTNKSNESLPLN
jgi:hypothetical protein